MNPLKFFDELMQLKTFVKLHHWAVKGVKGSYATHVALDELESDLGDLIDGLVETYQGKYGVSSIKVGAVAITMPVLEKLKAFAEMASLFSFPANDKSDSYLQNQVDEIVAVLYKGIYKLENLND